MCKYCSSIIGCLTQYDDLNMAEHPVWCESLVNNLWVKFYLNISATTAMCKGCSVPFLNKSFHYVSKIRLKFEKIGFCEKKKF